MNALAPRALFFKGSPAMALGILPDGYGHLLLKIMMIWIGLALLVLLLWPVIAHYAFGPRHKDDTEDDDEI